MVQESQALVQNVFNADSIAKLSTRDGFGVGLVEVGERDGRVVALSADLLESTRVEGFQKRFPERYVEVGVAEQNLAALASGFANYGKIPFIASYAMFSPGRNWEQIRTTISLNNLSVKIVGSHAGVSVGPDGATHQQLEDIALMRVQPNMNIIVPADYEEARKAVHVAYETAGPVYIRLAREKTPVFTTPASPFAFGKANILFDSDDATVALFACGPLTYSALIAARQLLAEGIKAMVINTHSVKPIDEEGIVRAAEKTGAIVSIEEHQIAGGFGSAIAEVLARRHPTPQEFVGVRDTFGQSGKADELIEHYGMGVGSIKDAARRALQRK